MVPKAGGGSEGENWRMGNMLKVIVIEEGGYMRDCCGVYENLIENVTLQFM